MTNRNEIVAEARARVATQIARQRAALENAPDHIRVRLAPYPFGLPSREDSEVAKATGYSSNEVLHLGKDFCCEHPANEVSETVDAPPDPRVYGLTARRYRELVLAAHRCAEKYPVEVIEDLRPERRIVVRSDAALTDEGRLRLRNLLVSAAIANVEGGRG